MKRGKSRMSISHLIGKIVAIIGLIAAIIAIYQVAAPIIEKGETCSNIKYLEEVPSKTLNGTRKIFLPKPKEGVNKILEIRPEEVFQAEVQESIGDNMTITFFAAKTPADYVARTCLKDSKLVYSILTSYDVFASSNIEPYIRTYSWAYLYRRDKEFLLIHVGNDLKPMGYRWTETDEKKLSKYPFISEDDLRIDSDYVYDIAEKNEVFLYKGALILTSVDTLVDILASPYLDFLDRGSPYWVLEGRYFISSKTGKFFDGYDLQIKLEGEPPHEIKIDDEVYSTITYKNSIPSLDITFNEEVDLKKGNIVLDEYERWKNVYEYNWWGDIVGKPIRARTIDKIDNQILATMEIRFEGKKIFFSEKHWGESENIIYEGFGEIHPATGFKQNEQMLSGKKTIEYYHRWPLMKIL